MRRVLLPASGLHALVDDVDYPLVVPYRWGKTNDYAMHAASGLHMHRLILGLGPGDPEQVDHRNGNGLDNRRSNLRIATTQQNGQNKRSKRGSSSRFKGVMWEKDRQKWVARIQVHGRYLNLGRFHDEEDAARAYDAAAREHFGEFARPNLVPA